MNFSVNEMHKKKVKPLQKIKKCMNKLSVRLLAAFLLVALLLNCSLAWAASQCSDILRGIQARYAGNYDEAIRRFERAVIEGNDAAKAFLQLGIAYELKGNHQKAKRYYEKALKINPDHVCARFYLQRLTGGKTISKRANLVEQAITGVSPAELAQGYTRYKGMKVVLRGWLVSKPNRRGRKTELLASTLPTGRTGGRMEGFFLIRTKGNVPRDQRLRRGAKIAVRGVVADREFVTNPITKLDSTKKKVVIDPDGIKVVHEKTISGALTLRLK